MHPWCAQLQHPTDVGRGHEMPCRPQKMGAQDVTFVKGVHDVLIILFLQTQGDGPPGHGKFLALHGAQPCDHLCRPGKCCFSDALVEQPLGDDVAGGHWAYFEMPWSGSKSSTTEFMQNLLPVG